MSKRIVIALGGNALGKNLPEQMKAVKVTSRAIVDLIEDGNEVVICHGNGPQVGMIQSAMAELTRSNPEEYIPCPLSVCVAMSQGYIGYDLQKAIRAELLTRGIQRTVCTVLTQVLVDPYDEAFYEPNKVVGGLLTEAEAREEEKKGNYVLKTHEGWRRALASPQPRDIVELESVKALLDAGQVVICCGGGGIPVIEQGVDLRGASAVIEKDLTAGLLAMELDADVLMLLTSVDAVALNYRKDNEKILGRISVRQARSYMEENHFEAGKMQPKFEAAINFVEMGSRKRAVITSIDRARAGYLGKAGTEIVQEL